MVNILCNTPSIAEKWCFDEYKKYIRPDAKVTIIPFSFKDIGCLSPDEFWAKYYDNVTGKYYGDYVLPLLKYGVEEENIYWINYFEDTVRSAKEKMRSSDILYFTGGLPDKMYDRLIEFDLIETVKEHKGVMIGCSAGAMVQLSEYHITPDDDYAEFSYYRGIGLLDGFDIEVHFEEAEEQIECADKALEEKNKPIYLMYNNGALIVDNGSVHTVGQVKVLGADMREG